MIMKAYATKLIDVTERHAEEIARNWYEDVRKNARTASYRKFNPEDAIRQAVEFYRSFRGLFFTEKPYEAAEKYFRRYAEDRYRDGVPLDEAIYALVLMRRHMWLYAEFQVTFQTAVEHHQAAENLNRTILMFDYAVNVISREYQYLVREEIDRELGALQSIRMDEPSRNSFKTGVIGALFLGIAFLTYYSHAVIGSGIIFTHLFYIPIILGAIWWRKKGILIAAALGAWLILSHIVFLAGAPLIEDVIRSVMFIVIGTVVALLSEGLVKAETLYGVEVH